MARQGLEIKHKRSFHWVSVALWMGLFVLLATIAWFGYRYFTTGELPPAISVGALAADTSVDETPISESQRASYSVAADEPRYLSIPSQKIAQARILKTGVDANNLLAFTQNINDVGWYQKSAVIGQGYGVILLTGHNKGAKSSGAFSKIGTLKPGAEIVLERGDGEEFTYTVKEVQTMTVQEASQIGMKTMLEPIDETHEGLTLVTTEGNWVPRIKQFERRVIVRAVALGASNSKE